MKVKNVGSSPEMPWLELRLTKGNNLVTTFDCRTATLDRTTMDDYTDRYDAYEVRSAF